MVDVGGKRCQILVQLLEANRLANVSLTLCWYCDNMVVNRKINRVGKYEYVFICQLEKKHSLSGIRNSAWFIWMIYVTVAPRFIHLSAFSFTHKFMIYYVQHFYCENQNFDFWSYFKTAQLWIVAINSSAVYIRCNIQLYLWWFKID